MNNLRQYIPNFIINLIKNFSYKLYKFCLILISKSVIDKYDYETILVFKKKLKNNSNFIDIGANKGEILKELLKISPNGQSYAFEPIPKLFKLLKKKYNNKVIINNIALSNYEGNDTFSYFKDRPAVSGLKQRNFDKKYNVEKINIQVKKLDNVIPNDLKIDLIKIDVEGAEFQVLEGSINTIKNSKPLILFEFGQIGCDLYGSSAEKLYDFLIINGFVISLLEYYLKNKEHLNREEFIGQIVKGYNCFFIAYPV